MYDRVLSLGGVMLPFYCVVLRNEFIFFSLLMEVFNRKNDGKLHQKITHGWVY
jgi:hypothetical protein